MHPWMTREFINLNQILPTSAQYPGMHFLQLRRWNQPLKLIGSSFLEVQEYG